jgi:hypothetical protein
MAGGVPEPHELVGREHVIKFIWEQLAGNNVLLVAPRRFGKTGVMNHLLKLPKAGYLPVYLDVEDIHDPDRFAAALVACLLEHDQVRRLVTGIKDLPACLLHGVEDRLGKVKAGELEVELHKVIRDSWPSVTNRVVLELRKRPK